MQKDYCWNTSTYIWENSKYLKSIAGDSVIACDEIISVMDVPSTKMTHCSNKCSKISKIYIQNIYFACNFIGDININNCYYLLSLYET